MEETEIEEQRYGRNKDTQINLSYIDSGEYRRKFDLLSGDPELNKLIYQLAKKILKHRSGTKFEDMYWINSETKSYFDLKVAMFKKKGYNESEARIKVIEYCCEHFDITYKEVILDD